MIYEARPGSIDSATQWVTGLASGSMASALLTLAIAGIGFGMLSGRLPIRRAGLVIVGCFIFIGAPTIALALMGWTDGEARVAENSSEIFNPTTELQPAQTEIVQEGYDPYAGAALAPTRPAN